MKVSLRKRLPRAHAWFVFRACSRALHYPVRAVITLYSTRSCGYCVAARRLLQARGYAFDEIDVSRDRMLRERISLLAGNYRMVPMIFIGNAFIGGYDELAVLDRSGELAARMRSTLG